MAVAQGTDLYVMIKNKSVPFFVPFFTIFQFSVPFFNFQFFTLTFFFADLGSFDSGGKIVLQEKWICLISFFRKWTLKLYVVQPFFV
jgi:hypothetical protein